MDQKMKKERLATIASPILYVLLGVAAIYLSGGETKILCYVAAGILAVWGIVSIIVYLCRSARHNFTSNGFMWGLIFILLGAFAYFKADMLVSLIPYVLAFLICLNGIRELQNTIDVRKLHLKKIWIVAILALINLALGIVLMLDLPIEPKMLMTILGSCLIFSGVIDLITTIVVYIKIRKMEKSAPMDASENAPEDHMAPPPPPQEET